LCRITYLLDHSVNPEDPVQFVQVNQMIAKCIPVNWREWPTV